MKDKKKQVADKNKLLTIYELSDAIDYSRQTIYSWIKEESNGDISNKFPIACESKSYLFDLVEVRKYIKRRLKLSKKSLRFKKITK